MRVISVPPWIKASQGRAFHFGQTTVYVGPREPSPGARNLKRPPVLAYSRAGDTEPHIVGEFPNTATAEQFMAALTLGIEEAATAAANSQRPDLAPAPDGEPRCGDAHAVETPFGMIPAICERPPHDDKGEHAGVFIDGEHILPAGFPRRATWAGVAA